MTFTIPNLLSLLRMGLIPLFIIMVVNGDPPKALLIFLVAGVTDALDGFIARFWKQQSPLGAYLDPMADKLLLTTAYVVLAIPSLNHGGTQIPAWVTILVIARDVLIVAVALVLSLAAGIRNFPRRRSARSTPSSRWRPCSWSSSRGSSGTSAGSSWRRRPPSTWWPASRSPPGSHYIYLFSHRTVRDELKERPGEAATDTRF